MINRLLLIMALLFSCASFAENNVRTEKADKLTATAFTLLPSINLEKLIDDSREANIVWLIKNLNQLPQWNPTHPYWREMEVIIRNDLKPIYRKQTQRLSEVTGLPEGASLDQLRNWQLRFYRQSILQHLSSNDDLDALIMFYSSEKGVRYLKLLADMNQVWVQCPQDPKERSASTKLHIEKFSAQSNKKEIIESRTKLLFMSTQLRYLGASSEYDKKRGRNSYETYEKHSAQYLFLQDCLIIQGDEFDRLAGVYKNDLDTFIKFVESKPGKLESMAMVNETFTILEKLQAEFQVETEELQAKWRKIYLKNWLERKNQEAQRQ